MATKKPSPLFIRVTKEEKKLIVEAQKAQGFHTIAEYVRVIMIKDAKATVAA